jgi:LCP family protein required for cell wall assembly
MNFRIRHLHENERLSKRTIAKGKDVILHMPWKKLIALGFLIGRPLFDLGRKMKERRERQLHIKRALAMGTAFVVALTIALLTFSLLLKISGFSVGTLLTISGTPVGTTAEGVTNVLLLGEGDSTGENLIDTIIVASLDPQKSQSVSLLSLPRDLYFLHTDHAMKTKKGKLTSLWRDNAILHMKEGMATEAAGDLSLTELAAEIAHALSIPIHHVLKVNFTAAEEVIDAIGGIEITVPEAIHDTAFPGPNYSYTTFHIDAGAQRLDGRTALRYARTRSTTSDFDRSQRQQLILRSAAKKARESGILKNPRKIMELYGILAEHIQTDLKTRQMVTLAEIVKGLDPNRFSALQINNVNGLYGDQLWKGGILYAPPREIFSGDSVLLPVSMPEFPVTWKQVRTLTHLFFDNRHLYGARPVFAILNGGAPEGSARKVYRELTKFGFDVAQVRNVPGERDLDSSFITANVEEAEPVRDFFAALLQIVPGELPPDTLDLRCSGDKECFAEEFGTVTLVLGKDFEFQFFQELVDP